MNFEVEVTAKEASEIYSTKTPWKDPNNQKLSEKNLGLLSVDGRHTIRQASRA